MTCGIYLLKFIGTNKVYIGQSVNIEYRYRKHLQKLRNGSHNYKMLKAFEDYGEPILQILLDNLCKEELSAAEQEAFAIFNCIDNGFNVSRETEISGTGDKNPASKYSNEKIEEVFFLLLDLNNRYKDIEEKTGVSLSTVRHISNSEAHLWLKEKYPAEYSELEKSKGLLRQQSTNSAESRGILYPQIVSPEGVVYTVKNVAQFAREHNLDNSSLSKVLKKRPKYLSHKGWKIR